MRKYITMLLLIILLIGVNPFTYAYDKVNWKEVVEIKKEKINQEKDYVNKYELAVALANTGQIEKATKTFKSMDKLKEKNKKIKNMIKKYSNEFKNNNSLLTLNYLSFAHFINDNFKKSENTLTKIKNNNPENNIWNYNYLAIAKFKLEKYKESEKLLQKSLKTKENDYTYFLLGVNYYKMGNLFKATYYVNKGKEGAKLFL